MTHSPIRSLEARYYTDPGIFAQERSGLLSKTWQFAGHISQIPKAGDYFTFSIAGESLFCIRGHDEKIRTFFNVCQHRAHQLVSGSGKARLVVCPYHAWSYDLRGQLKAGPNIDSIPGLERSKICLTEVLTENFLGYLFVNLDNQAAPMEEWFPGVKAELMEYVPHIESLSVIDWVGVEEACNWKVSVENYSECYHCEKNHPTFAQGVVKPQTYDIQPMSRGYTLRHTTECQNLETMTYPIDLEANDYAGEYRSWFLWPMFSFQCYPGNILNTYHWRAHDHQSCAVWRGWYVRDKQDEREAQIIRNLAIQDRQTTVEEDITLVESVQRGLQSRGYVPGPLVVDPAGGVNSEHSIAALQRWMREGVDSD